MKKFSYLLLGLAGLTMASCSNDDLVAPGTGDGNFAVTVKLPVELGTRAEQNQGEGYYGQGYQALELWYAVYEVDAEGNRISTVPVTTGEANFPNDLLYTTVGFNLANSKYYSIAFFALSKDAEDVYSWNTTEGTISVEYENMTYANNNADAYDCFYNLHSTGKIGDTNTSLNQTVILNRPVAQINWGTSDYDEDAVTDPNAFGDTPVSSLQTTFTTQAYNTFDMFTKDVTGEMVPVTFENFAVPTEGKFPVFEPVINSETGEPTDENVYQYVAMQYVLAPAASSVMNLNLNIQNPTATYNDDVAVNNAPVQANFRTNIYGTLLTDNLNLTVEKDPIWGNPDYDIVEDGQSLLAGLRAGNNVMLNKDITFSQYVKIDKPVSLDLNGHNITWDKAEDGAFYVVEGGNLTISGQGTITASKHDYQTLVWVDGGEATIHNGTFVGSGAGQLIYCQKGTITIYGGTYNLIGTELNKEYFYPINCQDQPYKDGEANIIVKGGVYYNFNPANNPAEGPNTNFVANGYISKGYSANGITYYAVVPEGTDYPVFPEIQSTIRQAGNLVLATDFSYNGTYCALTQNANVNLNGFSLTSDGGSTSGDAIVVGNGANVTISNGTLLPAENAFANGSSATINLMTAGGGKLTLNDVTVIGDMYPVMLTSSNANAEIIINSGEYHWNKKWDGSENTDKDVAVYVTSPVGKVTINGGTFGKAGCFSEFLLNVQDSARNGRQPNEIITVYGGTFINFNPANNKAEGEGTNFVAEGYTVTSKKVGSDTYYTVVKAN